MTRTPPGHGALSAGVTVAPDFAGGFAGVEHRFKQVSGAVFAEVRGGVLDPFSSAAVPDVRALAGLRIEW